MSARYCVSHSDSISYKTLFLAASETVWLGIYRRLTRYRDKSGLQVNNFMALQQKEKLEGFARNERRGDESMKARAAASVSPWHFLRMFDLAGAA